MAVLFDIDGTLYTDAAYGAHQMDILVAELARIRGVTVAEASAEVGRARERLSAAEGRTTSLGNAMAALGVDLPTSVAWRERLIEPEAFLKPDPLLDGALARLTEAGIALVAVTNNPRSTGLRSLAALSVAGRFKAVVGLDDTMKSKPAREPYELAAKLAGAAWERCVSVGDRYDVDLALPLSMGMGAVLVRGVEDVYGLPEALGL